MYIRNILGLTSKNTFDFFWNQTKNEIKDLNSFIKLCYFSLDLYKIIGSERNLHSKIKTYDIDLEKLVIFSCDIMANDLLRIISNENIQNKIIFNFYFELNEPVYINNI